jgi:hypothetical protein
MSTSPWPYPSYPDRQWLGGERGPDRALAAVIRALRTTSAESGTPATSDPQSLLSGLAQLAAISERVEWAMLSLVGEARANGVPWATIGAALGVTKQAAQQRFAPYVKQALEQAQQQAQQRSA